MFCSSAALPMQMQELIVGIRSGAALRFVSTCLSSGHMPATISLLLLCLVIGCFVLSVVVSCFVFAGVCFLLFSMFLRPLPYIPRSALPERANHQTDCQLVAPVL